MGDLALISGKIDLAIASFEACNDLSSLLMIYTGLGRKDLLEALAMKAESLENYNISFISYFTLVSKAEDVH